MIANGEIVGRLNAFLLLAFSTTLTRRGLECSGRTPANRSSGQQVRQGERVEFGVRHIIKVDIPEHECDFDFVSAVYTIRYKYNTRQKFLLKKDKMSGIQGTIQDKMSTIRL